MRLRLINNFLRNGEVLGVRPGTKFVEIVKLLGKPQSVDLIDIGTNLYYGDIRILSSESEGGVWFIEIEGGLHRSRNRFIGNKSLQILSEGLLPGLSRKQTVRLLKEHGLKTEIRQPNRSIPRPEGDHVEWCYLQVPSGATITFERFGIDNPTSEFRLLKLDVGKYGEARLKPRDRK
jgi:hypothetical protein